MSQQVRDTESAPGRGGSGRRPGPRSGSRSGRRLGAAVRAGWNLADQVLSAATNVALAVVVVRVAGAAAFDAFAIAFLVFSTAIGVERSLVGSSLNIRHSAETGRARSRTVSRATGTVLALMVPTGGAVLGAGLLFGGRLGAALVATGVVLPFLTLQDACRYAFFSGAESWRAAANDALWAVVQFSAMGILAAAGAADVATLVLAWGGSAALCAAVALVQLRAWPDLRAAPGWIRDHRDLVGYLLGDYLLTTGAFNGGYLLVGVVLGDQAVGSIRAAQVLLGPLGIVATALRTFGLPEISRRAAHLTSARGFRIAAALSVGMVALSVLYGTAVLLAPAAVGEAVFAQKWGGAQAVLLPLVLAQLATTATMGPSVVVYALGQARRTFQLMVVEAPLVLVLMLGGAALAGVRGAAWGQCLDQFLMVALWVYTLRRVLAGADDERGPAAPS